MGRIFRSFLVLLLMMGGMLSSRSLSFEQIHAMPKSVEKDYYIWRYLSGKKSTKSEARKLIHEAKRINGKLARAYRQKTGHKAPLRRRSHPSLSPERRKILAQKKKQTLKLLRSDHPWKAWQALPVSMQVFVFNHAGTAGRRRLDYPVTAAHYARLSRQPAFNESIRRILREHLPRWSQTLLHPPTPKHRLSHRSLIALGFHALRHGKPAVAEAYFRLAAEK